MPGSAVGRLRAQQSRLHLYCARLWPTACAWPSPQACPCKNTPHAQVVPFSPSSGLLEWVESTLPLADYLLGPTRTGGAHARYRRSGDLTWVNAYHEVGRWGRGAERGGTVGGLEVLRRGPANRGQRCRAAAERKLCHPPPRAPQLAKVVQGAGQPSHAALRAAFTSVCGRFPPVMHHFFLENFRDPGGLLALLLAGWWACCWLDCWLLAGWLLLGLGWLAAELCAGVGRGAGTNSAGACCISSTAWPCPHAEPSSPARGPGQAPGLSGGWPTRAAWR